MKKFTLVFIALQICSHSIYAQWSGDPQVADTKVCTAVATEHASRTVPDGSGGVIVFWQDSRNGFSSGDNIYYNKLNSSGSAVWSLVSEGIPLVTNPSAGYYIDQVISDGSGGAFVSWDTEDEVFLQHINSAGATTWTTDGISLSTTGYGALLCSDGNGGVIVTWNDYRNDLTYGRPEAYAQRIGSDGLKKWGAGDVLLANVSDFSGPLGIVSDGSKGAIISFGDTRNSNYDTEKDEYDNVDIYAQRLNASGVAVWAANGVAVCTQPKNQAWSGKPQYPYMISDGSGGAIIAWEDFRDDPNNGNRPPANGDLYCQRINSSGVAQWAANGVALCTASSNQYNATLMPDGTGGAVVTWYDERTNFRVYAQKVNGSGVVQWAADGILVAEDTNPSLSYSASPDATNSSMLVSWSVPGAGDIRAQKINVADGTFAWGATGTLVCGRSDIQKEPSITHNGGGGAIISWTDKRNATSDIYASHVLPNGTLPLTLVTFEAQLINEDVLLKWSTSSEQNTSYFDVERSADGNYFSSIGKVNAAGNSTSTIKYSLPDNAPHMGTNFYRLKMVDIDGKFSYSKTVAVKIENLPSLRVYPNPATNTLYIETNGANENAVIQIIDLSGKKVKEQKVVLTGNTPIDISNLPKSIYEIIIKTDKNTQQQKFVKE